MKILHSAQSAFSASEDERKKQFERMKAKFNSGKNSNKGGGNNFYWIYGAVIAVLMFMIFFGNDTTGRMVELKQPADFYNKMLAKGDVVDVVIVNKSTVRITINPDSVSKLDRYKDPKTGKSYFENQYKGPHFYFSIADVTNFENKLEKVQTEAGIPKDQQVSPRSVEETHWMSDQLTWILPLVIMIAIWFFMMRRMGGGSGGGPGQIFNIGKSKATLFDKDTQVNINFNDVAGLDGAKMEVMEIVDFFKKSKKIYRFGRQNT